jgi:hypothetical protein
LICETLRKWDELVDLLSDRCDDEDDEDEDVDVDDGDEEYHHVTRHSLCRNQEGEIVGRVHARKRNVGSRFTREPCLGHRRKRRYRDTNSRPLSE